MFQNPRMWIRIDWVMFRALLIFTSFNFSFFLTLILFNFSVFISYQIVHSIGKVTGKKLTTQQLFFKADEFAI